MTADCFQIMVYFFMQTEKNSIHIQSTNSIEFHVTE